MSPWLRGRTHLHKTISESFFVLSGTVRLFDGQRWIDATAGDFLYVPVGGLHAFGNESDRPASMLLLFAPGAPREDYFEGLARIGQLSPEEQAAFFEHHDTYWIEHPHIRDGWTRETQADRRNLTSGSPCRKVCRHHGRPSR